MHEKVIYIYSKGHITEDKGCCLIAATFFDITF